MPATPCKLARSACVHQAAFCQHYQSYRRGVRCDAACWSQRLAAYRHHRAALSLTAMVTLQARAESYQAQYQHENRNFQLMLDTRYQPLKVEHQEALKKIASLQQDLRDAAALQVQTLASCNQATSLAASQAAQICEAGRSTAQVCAPASEPAAQAARQVPAITGSCS